MAASSELSAHSLAPPSDKAPTKFASVLIVGTNGTGKKTIFNLLKQSAVKGGITLEVHTINTLPLPDNPNRQRIDFIIFLVDMTNKESLSKTERCMERHVHPDYFNGRTAVVVTKGDLHSSYAFPLKELDGMPDNEHTPAAKSAQSTGDKLIRLIETANHYKNATPLFLKTLDLSMVARTTREG